MACLKALPCVVCVSRACDFWSGDGTICVERGVNPPGGGWEFRVQFPNTDCGPFGPPTTTGPSSTTGPPGEFGNGEDALWTLLCIMGILVLGLLLECLRRHCPAVYAFVQRRRGYLPVVGPRDGGGVGPAIQAIQALAPAIQAFAQGIQAFLPAPAPAQGARRVIARRTRRAVPRRIGRHAPRRVGPPTPPSGQGLAIPGPSRPSPYIMKKTGRVSKKPAKYGD